MPKYPQLDLDRMLDAIEKKADKGSYKKLVEYITFQNERILFLNRALTLAAGKTGAMD